MSKPMKSTERHATHAEDWRAYGANLAFEAHHMGGQFSDARRLMLDTWEAWTSSEPGTKKITYELLATLWAMAMSTGIDGLDGPLEEFASQVAEIVEGQER